MVCTLYWVLLISTLLYAGLAQPGDPECPQSYPLEWKVLFDSHRYETLQDIFTSTSSNSFIQAGGNCQQGFSVCSFSSPSCLFTPCIPYGNGMEIFFNISCDFGICRFYPNCKPYLTLFICDKTSNTSQADQLNKDNCVPILGSVESSRLHQSDRVSNYKLIARNRPENATGFKLKFKDEGTCCSLLRILIYYRICSERIIGLVRYPEMSVPPRSAPNSTFQASCASNSHNVTSMEVIINSATGDCIDKAPGGARCECDGGYYQNATICQPCLKGTYRAENSLPTNKCVECPTNTLKDKKAATQCQCIFGYFRDVPREGPEIGCTKPPNRCTNLRAIDVSLRSVTLQWSKPSEIGRKDLYYQVYVSDPSRPGEFNLVNQRQIELRSVVTYTVSNLSPSQTYRFRVVPHNGVSDQDEINNNRRWCEVTAATRQGVPGTVQNVQAFCSVIVWEPPTQTNGNIQNYEVLVTPGGVKNVTTNYYITTEEERSASTTVQVRARNGAGVGELSNNIATGCTEADKCPQQATPVPTTCVPPPTSTSCPRVPCPLCPSPKPSTPCNCPTVPTTKPISCPTCPSPKRCPELLITSEPKVVSTTAKEEEMIPPPTTPKPAERSTQKPVLQETTQQLVEETTQQLVEETTQQLVEETTQQLVEETTQQLVEETTQQLVEETTQQLVEETTQKPAEETTAEESTTLTPTETTTSATIPGFYFVLRGRIHQNNSVVFFEDIGERSNGLRCVSENNQHCCNRVGEFYYPNGTLVPINRVRYGLYRNRQRYAQPPYIRLNRRENVILTEGVYKCEVPYGDNLKHSLFISLVSKSNFGNIQALFSSPNNCPNKTSTATCLVPGVISAGATFLATTVMSLSITLFCIIRCKNNKKLDHTLSAMENTQTANTHKKKCAPHLHTEESNIDTNPQL